MHVKKTDNPSLGLDWATMVTAEHRSSDMYHHYFNMARNTEKNEAIIKCVSHFFDKFYLEHFCSIKHLAIYSQDMHRYVCRSQSVRSEWNLKSFNKRF
jgi:hypothetical protein